MVKYNIQSVFLISSICLSIPYSTISISYAANCSNGAAADQIADKTRLEYGLGTPKKVDVEDNGSVRKLSYSKIGNMAVFEGDIVLGDADQIEFAAQAGPIKTIKSEGNDQTLTPFGYVAKSVVGGASRWTNNTIPYAIDPSLDAGTILKAMQAWENKTKIKFVERTPENSSNYRDYVQFEPGTVSGVCLTHGVGMSGGKQRVSLVADCGFGEIVHEIGHVIGLDHEQNRSDRDNYVTVNYGNIIDGYTSQFDQRPSKYSDIGSYDFDSIMHYYPTAFTCNNQPTITTNVPLPPGVHLGQRSHISSGDAQAVNLFYK